MYKGLGRYATRMLKEISPNKRLSCSLVRILSSFIFDRLSSQLRQCITMQRKLNRRTIKLDTVKYAWRINFSSEMVPKLESFGDALTKAYRER